MGAARAGLFVCRRVCFVFRRSLSRRGTMRKSRTGVRIWETGRPKDMETGGRDYLKTRCTAQEPE